MPIYFYLVALNIMRGIEFSLRAQPCGPKKRVCCCACCARTAPT